MARNTSGWTGDLEVRVCGGWGANRETSVWHGYFFSDELDEFMRHGSDQDGIAHW